MWAIAAKEFNQLRRDRRMLAMLVAIPLLLLVVFGYAASFDVSAVPTVVVGPHAEAVSARLPGLFDVRSTDAGQGRDDAVDTLRDGTATAAVVTAADGTTRVLVDGTDLFAARAVSAGGNAAHLPVEVLFNPDLTTSVTMVPGLIGIVLVFVGTLATALGVVRERQAGTLEQLAVMPFRAWEVFLGKVVPYFLVATLDTGIVVTAGITLFGVPFNGSVGTFTLGVLLFLFVTLGIGVLISTVSQNQGQAMQLAMMTLLPQVLLSGLLFPIASMAAGVRWISYFLPLTYFIQVSRGVLVKATPIGALWFPLVMLAVLGVAVFSLSVLRFGRDLAPKALR
ncbi:MAG TPA: ABC transporter permease [Kutzneria sp.]|jgi:ABC-2 type transport system permease protein|nr:ABC transporter permease [Kutzneria sp.]